MGSSLVFPAPKEERFPQWMECRLKFFSKPKNQEKKSGGFTLFCCGDRKQSSRIPYLYFKQASDSNSSKHLVIYFHANSELLSRAFNTLEKYHNILDVDVIAPEYPGYGLYENEEPSEKTIMEDAILVVQHCIQKLQYKEENIILIGRSLGTGVAIQIGAIFKKLRALILISPFQSVRYVGEQIAGWTLSNFLPDIFRNEDYIQKVRAPVLFIHGMKDKLVPWTASKILFKKCTSVKAIHLSESMGHNDINFKNDVFLPILKFLGEELQMEQFNLTSGMEWKQKLYLLTESDEFPYLKTKAEAVEISEKANKASENDPSTNREAVSEGL